MTNTDVVWDGTKHSYRPAPDWRDRISAGPELHVEAADSLDPVTFEIIRHRLWTINMAHGETVTRISGSPVFASGDFNMMILSEDAEVVLNAPFMQFLNAGAPQGISYIMENFGEDPGIHDGDIFVGNDPWIAAVHQMDVLVAAPVFIDGKLFAWVSNAGHQYDLGGPVPGGWPQSAVDVHSDPVVLTPFKLVEQGKMRKDLERMYLRHSRNPEFVALDLGAQLAGVRFARDAINEMCERFGATTVKAVMRRILDSAQRSFREKLERIPDGTYSEVRYIDEKLPGDRATYRFQVNLRKTGDRITIDNVGTDPQTDEGPIGTVFNSFCGSVLGVLSTSMLYEQLFAVGGATRQITYDPTPGLITCADYPAAVSAGILNVVTQMGAVQTCIDRMLATDPALKRDIVAPAPDYLVPVVAGEDDRGGSYGQAILDHMAMGSGARSFGDGVDTGGPSWSPLTFLLNAEAVEQWYPMVYLYRAALADSGGAGRHRGGLGLKYAWTPYRANSMSVVSFAGGMSVSTHCSEGLFGGYPSPPGHMKVRRSTDLLAQFESGRVPRNIEDVKADEDTRIRGKSNGIDVQQGDVIEATISGGGGFGDPFDREPERVARDLVIGAISAHAASTVYGVELRDGTVDVEGTARRRAEIRESRRGWSAVASGSGKPTPATGDEARSVHEYLTSVDRDGSRVLACSACDGIVAGYHDRYKDGLVSLDTELGTLPGFIDPAEMLDDHVVLRQYACPGCGTLMAGEITRSSEEPFEEVRFA